MSDFKDLLDIQFNSMYDDNKISISDMHELRYYSDMYRKAYNFDFSQCSFEEFELKHIFRGTEFLEINKEEYRMNEYAQEVCEFFFNIKGD